MPSFVFHAPCPFGLEELLSREILALNADPDLVRPGKGGVSFAGGLDLGMAVCLHSRYATRVLLRVAFDEYWDSRDVYSIARRTPWEKWFGPDVTFRIHSTANRCPLESLDFATLRIKDGLCDRFNELAGRRPSVDRRRPDVRLEAYFTFDHVSFYIDLAGESLFKRGWRLEHGEAPLKENLAAALLALSGWTPEKPLVDPFCGSGTICIEAALIALNRAPGLHRSFAAEKWSCVPAEVWRQARTEAMDREFRGDYHILGSDIDPASLDIARENARKAGVAKLIEFRKADATKMSLPTDKGLIVCNPPYGERMLEQRSAQRLYQAFGRHIKYADGWKKYIISSEPEFEHYFGKQAAKKRKLYNGRLQCNVYMYF